MVGTETFEKSLDGIVPLIEFSGRHQAAVLRVKQKDHAQQAADEAAVDFLWIALPDGSQQQASGFFIGRLKTPGEFEQGFQHLPGQSGGNIGLIVAALPQQSRKTETFRNGDEPPVGKQQIQCTGHGPTGDLGHEGHRKSDGT